jgi:hypothetical protein
MGVGEQELQKGGSFTELNENSTMRRVERGKSDNDI